MTCTRWVGLAAIGLLAGSLRTAAGAEDAAVQDAIDRGVAVLKRANGARYHPAGTASLVGLTLLECGVPADDPAVQQRAGEVREAAIELNHTYSLGLAIMFLDRLGDPGDRSLILSMGVRLLAGQNNAGGWSYRCPTPPEEEVRRLQSLAGQAEERRQLEKAKGPPELLRAPPPLPNEIKELMRKTRSDISPHAIGDNSNTQFAILGLWAARRHGLPIGPAMQRVAERFRRSQNADGSWTYMPGNRPLANRPSGAMTCAGLLGVAMSLGSINEAHLRTGPKTAPVRLPRDPGRDASVRAGLLALSMTIGGQPQAGQGPHMSKGYYYLWSVERVAVAYGLRTIGNKDWYAWGRAVLLESQQADGSWQGEYGLEIDTSFALLFLRRANVAPDLTVVLRGRVEDPGEATLKAGGIGGAGLNQSGIAWNRPDSARAESPESARLKQELLQASPEELGKRIEALRDGKGSIYTEALASAIPALTEPARGQARDALAERLTRMTAATLRDKLRDPDTEVRRAAALACAMKEDRSHTADLIELLDDPEVGVVRAALVGLQHLCGQDLGPHARPDDRAQTVAAWKEWWRRQ